LPPSFDADADVDGTISPPPGSNTRDKTRVQPRHVRQQRVVVGQVEVDRVVDVPGLVLLGGQTRMNGVCTGRPIGSPGA
jgi:hypothetical protein